MLQNVTEKKLTNKQESVAADVADDELTDEEIAVKAKITRMTLARWKLLPAFQARIAEIHEKARAKTIANKEYRLDALIDRQRRMTQVIEERASWYEGAMPD